MKNVQFGLDCLTSVYDNFYKLQSNNNSSSELVSRAFHQFLATFTFNPIHRLRALYAQSFRRTLTPPPPSYRGCWHGVSRGFFLESCHDRALDERALQAAFPFFTHAILLDRAFAHCPRFPIAAPRGSPGRVLVPVWLIIRKDQLSIIGLVSLYLTNYLILRRLIKQRFLAFFRIWPELFGRFPRITHPFATLFSTVPTSSAFLQGETSYLHARSLFSFCLLLLPENNIRLACVKHIASVPSKPG
ncbi:hypothetical protein Lal_00018406 [Lupinus albus]|nr:hypothetical protein Lal_00018406 [Lupinus albus]